MVRHAASASSSLNQHSRTPEPRRGVNLLRYAQRPQVFPTSGFSRGLPMNCKNVRLPNSSWTAPLLSLLIAVVVVLPARAWSEAPATAPAEYTDHQLVVDELNCNRRRFIDTYKAVGHKNPVWDAAAVEFLEQACRYLDYQSQYPPFQPDDMPTAAGLAQMGERLLAVGCDDAQVRYCYAVALTDLHRDGEAVEQLRLVFEQCKQGKFPPQSMACTAERLRGFRAYLKPGEDAALAAAEESSCIDMARGIRPARAERRVLLSIYRSALEKDHRMQARICSALQKMKDADPWLVECVCGQYEVSAAWGARGADSAARVTPNGWEGFEEHLAKARQYLTKAWQLEPGLPDPAYDMIIVTMGDGGHGGDTLRTWFDRAREAKFDERDALARILWGLRPRWGGSWEQMLALGRECAQTDRFDTTVPAWLITAVQEVADDAGDKTGRTWADPAIYPDVERVFAGYEQAMPAGRRRDWFRSWHAAVAWRAGKFEESRRLLEQLTTPVALDRFGVFTKEPELMASQVFAYTGSHADRARKATADAEAGRLAEAAKAFRELADAAADDDKAAFYFDDYATKLETRIHFEGGDWADLIPKRGIHGWTAAQGNWSIDPQGHLVGQWDEGGLLLISQPDLGKRYEIEATLRYESPKCSANGVGLALDHNGETYGNGLFYSSGYNSISPYVNFKGIAESATIPTENAIHIEAWDGGFRATLNGQPVNVPEPEGPILNAGGTPRLAIYSLYPPTDTKICVTSLKVRRLKEQPAQ
jgi:hypothetical protein